MAAKGSRARRNIVITIAVILVIIFLFGKRISIFYMDWLWFGETGYRSVFWTRLLARLELGVIAGLLFFVILYGNLWLARKISPPIISDAYDDSFRGRASRVANRVFTFAILGISLAVAIMVGIEASTHWLSLQTFTHATEFGQKDPIFGLDIGFYVFKLGFLRYIYKWLMFALIVAFAATALVHYMDRAIDLFAGITSFAPHVKAHLSFIFALILLVQALGFKLNTYGLLYSPGGVVFGPGYTDIHGHLIAYNILAIIAIVSAILSLANIKRRGLRLPAYAVIILVGTYIVFDGLFPLAIQQFAVKPDELRKEMPFISNNIKLTRAAFDLDKMNIRNFPDLQPLTREDIEKNRTTINSIRLWDYRPLQSTYSQLQSLWQYYTINNVDVDRYMVNGEYRQVMLAARELSSETGQTGAGTWVNRHFQYTHGYGAVMSPVNSATEEGLPEFFIKDMPPKSAVGIHITRPQIYFGEETNDYVIVNSSMKEFDYPSEGKPVYTSYEGAGGIPIGGYLQRIAFALGFSDLNLVLKNPINSNSRLMYRRNIMERVQTIFPFMMYDSDPYLVISNGKLYWMIDGYTVSRNYPYSTPHEVSPMAGYDIDYYLSMNYIRNSAKILIDAYEGTVKFYTADETDPMIKTFSKIFPGVFRPISEMDPDIYRHIRYPEMLFRIQTEVLFNYHMVDPQVFYNKGDRWDTPKEIVDVEGQETPMEPYYVIMKLPGSQTEQFLIMRPFTQALKNNMVAWMGAMCDPMDYGKILLYQFPKDELVYGPAQIEATINQNPVISPQLTLWNQMGTKVFRGNMIVIPIEKSILYVKPLYLQSETSKIPELARVVVVNDDKVIMDKTLEGALEKLFGPISRRTRLETSPIPGQLEKPEMTPISTDIKALIDQAVTLFNEAQERQRAGDWAGYGAKVKQLESTLRQLKQLTSK